MGLMTKKSKQSHLIDHANPAKLWRPGVMTGLDADATTLKDPKLL